MLVTSVIFPAFVNEYRGTEGQIISAFGNNFPHLLASASDMLKTDLTGFDFINNNFLQDELKSQYISYIFSCSIADILKSHNVRPSFVSGYSMGIYAAMYCCGSVDFVGGLIMVKRAWELICGVTTNGRYRMGMIIGLTESDLLKLLHGVEDVEICNQNNPYTFIISGSGNAVESVLLAAQAEGAMRTTILPVSKPYHSQFLKNAAPGFAASIKKISVLTPACPYISAMDQKVIDTAGDLRKEVIVNLPSRMNWYETMNTLLKKGTDIIFECGAGDGLTRNARFIEGSFQSFSVDKIERFIEIVSKESS